MFVKYSLSSRLSVKDSLSIPHQVLPISQDQDAVTMIREADHRLLCVYTTFEYTVFRKRSQSKPSSVRFTKEVGD